MDYVKVMLPCGFSVKYQDILYNSDKFPCPACKTHDITREECLNMTRNMLALNNKSYELKKNDFDELMMVFKIYKNDPKHYIDESFDCLKREVDLRREDIKLMLNKEIDDYHDGLLERIDMERDLKLKELEEKIQKAESLDLAIFKIDEKLDIHSRLEFYRKSKREIENGISLVQNIIDDFKEPKFRLTDSCDEIDIKKIFGEFYLRENTKIIFNNLEIDDGSCSEATIQLIINNFSIIKDKKNFRVFSKKCLIRNFEWHIWIELNEEDGWMQFYLYCNSTAKSNKFPVNANVVLSLLNKTDSKKDLSRKHEKLFTQNIGYGYSKFLEINEIMNPKDGYYDANEDSITLKAVVKVELHKNKE